LQQKREILQGDYIVRFKLWSVGRPAVDRCRTWHSITVAIKRRINVSQHFHSFWGAWRTIAGYEAIHLIRKGQACWSAAGVKRGLLHRFIVGVFGIEA